MNTQRMVMIVAFVTFSLAVFGQAKEIPTAKPEEVGLSSAKLQQIDKAVDKLIADKNVAGALIMVSRKGKLAFDRTYGFKDISQKKPMQKDAIFRIYSMTKPITTVAAMMLWEEGKFKLDDPVSKYLPEFKGIKVYAGGAGENAKYVASEREVTIRDLMRHTSGLGYGRGKTPVDAMFRSKKVMDRGSSLAAFTKKLATIPLKFQPGSKYEYGVSVDVLGRLVEVISGKPLDVFFAQRIFKPLDMNDSGFFVPKEKLARFATNYGPGMRVIDAPKTSRYLKKPAFLSGGGGMVSTGRDYMRFCQMLVNKGELDGQRILKAKTVELMSRNHLPKKALPLVMGNPRPGFGFGLGFGIRMAKGKDDPSSEVGEYRWGGAASTHFWISPRHELAVVALQQFMPFNNRIERAVKPVVYEAILE